MDLENLKQPTIDATTAEKQRDKLTSLEMQLTAASAVNDHEEAPPNDNLDKPASDIDIMKTVSNDDNHSENAPSVPNSNGDRMHGAQPKVGSNHSLTILPISL